MQKARPILAVAVLAGVLIAAYHWHNNPIAAWIALAGAVLCLIAFLRTAF